MSEEIFRKKSLDRVQSPENLNEYVRVTNPGLWIFLAAVIILLIGACIWGILGRLETTFPVYAAVQDGTLSCFIKDTDAAAVEENMTIKVAGEEFTIESIETSPVKMSDIASEYGIRMTEEDANGWVYTAKAVTSLKDGVYNAQIVTESVRPFSFILN